MSIRLHLATDLLGALVNFEVMGADDPGPFLTIVTSCCRCGREIGRLTVDVRDGPIDAPTIGEADAEAMKAHLIEEHGVVWDPWNA